MTLNKKRLWRAFAIAFIAVAVLGQVWYWHIWNVYYDTLPRSPDKLTGRVYPDNFHGIAVYETREEHLRLHAADYASEGLVFIVVLIGGLHEWKVRRARTERSSANL